MLYACDERWWARRAPTRSQVPGQWVSQDERAATRHGPAWVRGRKGAGLCRTPWEVHLGLNSGFQALNLAYHLGAARVLLVGFDMQVAKDGKTHFFGDYPPETGLQVPSPYADMAKAFGPLARDLEMEGVQVINCSTHTAIDCFPLGDITKEL